MAIQGIPLSVTAEYVSDLDPEKGTNGEPNGPGATRFTLGTLDAFAEAHVANAGIKFRGDGELELTPGMADVEAVRFGLRSFVGMVDASGSPIPFKADKAFIGGEPRDVASRDTIGVLPMALVRELAGKIRSLYVPPAKPAPAAE